MRKNFDVLSKIILCPAIGPMPRKLISPERAARFAKMLGYPEHYFIQLALQDSLIVGGFQLDVTISPRRSGRKVE